MIKIKSYIYSIVYTILCEVTCFVIDCYHSLTREHPLHALPPPGPNANVYAEVSGHSAAPADPPTPAVGSEEGYVSPEVIRERKMHSNEKNVSTMAPHYQPLVPTNREYAGVYTIPKRV